MDNISAKDSSTESKVEDFAKGAFDGLIQRPFNAAAELLTGNHHTINVVTHRDDSTAEKAGDVVGSIAHLAGYALLARYGLNKFAPGLAKMSEGAAGTAVKMGLLGGTYEGLFTPSSPNQNRLENAAMDGMILAGMGGTSKLLEGRKMYGLNHLITVGTGAGLDTLLTSYKQDRVPTLNEFTSKTAEYALFSAAFGGLGKVTSLLGERMPANFYEKIPAIPNLPTLLSWRAMRQPAPNDYVGKESFDLSKIMVKTKDGNQVIDKDSDLKKLPAGNFVVEFGNGRRAKIQIPDGLDKETNVPVVFLLPGASNVIQHPDPYDVETHLNDTVAQGSQKCILVTALTEKHKIGEDSRNKAYAWNERGALISAKNVEQHEKEVGYSEGDYFDAMFKLIPKITNASDDHNRWAFVGGSQGGATLNRLMGESRFVNTFPNLYIVGSSMEVPGPGREVDPYKIAAGNAKHVMVFDCMDDKNVLPHPQNQASGVKRFGLDTLQRLGGLDGVDAINQDPGTINNFFKRDISSHGEISSHAYVAREPAKHLKDDSQFTQEIAESEAQLFESNKKQDVRHVYTLKNDPDGKERKLEIYDLPTAKHVIPGSKVGSTSMNPDDKYDGISTAQIITDDFLHIIQNTKS